MEEKNINQYFASLILSLAASAWQQLGKVPDPITGKIEKNLENVKTTIDILDMLKQKTQNNLTLEEKKLLENAIADLQLNYVDELNKKNKSETLH